MAAAPWRRGWAAPACRQGAQRKASGRTEAGHGKGGGVNEQLHKDIETDVRECGRSVLCIGGEEDLPPFAYTIGNSLVDLPELLIIGTREGALLNDLSEKMLDRGRAFDDGELVNLGGKFPVKIITTNDVR